MTGLENIKLYASSSLTGDDYASLSLLYLPLMGSDSLGLYQALFNLIERNGFKSEHFIFNNLLDLFSMNAEGFIQSRKKLEALNLLEVYNKNDDYIYTLKQPLTPNQFLVDSIFGVYLKNKVGDEMFNLLVKHFEIERFNKKGFKNITVSFNDIFETVNNIDLDIDNMVLGRRQNKSIKIDNHKFSFEVFLSEIDESQIELGVTEGFKKTITNTAYIYGFNEKEMESLFRQSINSNGYFDQSILKNKSLTLFNYKNNTKGPSLKTKEKLSSKELESINIISNISFHDMLTTFNVNYPASYLKNMNEIYETVNIDREILSILVFGVLKDKNGELPSVNYFKKASLTWINNNIDTKEKAWEYINSTDKFNISNKETKSNKSNKTNKWLSDFKDNIMEGMNEI